MEQSHITSTGDRGDVEVPVVTGLCFGGLLGLVAGQLRDRQYGRRTSSGAVRNDRQSQSGALPGDSGNAPDAGPERGQRSRRRRRLSRLGIILICAVGGLLGGLVLAGSLRTPAVGEATILLRPLPGNAFAGRGGNTTVDLHTETAIPRSDEVLQRVSQADGNRVRPEELRPRLKVRVIEPTEVLALSFRAPNAARAKALAGRRCSGHFGGQTGAQVAEYARQSAILDPLIVAAEADLANVSAQPDNTDEVLALSDKLVTLRDQLNPVDRRGQTQARCWRHR